MSSPPLLMEAAVLEAYGDENQLNYTTMHPVPCPGPCSVLIQVHSCALTPDDVDMRHGAFLPFSPVTAAPGPLSLVPGQYLSGTIVAVGSHQPDLTVGDAVVAVASPALLASAAAAAAAEASASGAENTAGGVGAAYSGGLGAYACVPAAAVTKIPTHADLSAASAPATASSSSVTPSLPSAPGAAAPPSAPAVPLDVAAALIWPSLRAYTALHTLAAARPGSLVVVLPPASGSDTVLVTLAARLGCRVLAAVSSAAALNTFSDCSAVHTVVDLRSSRLTPAVLSVSAGAGADVVIDLAAAPGPAAAAATALAAAAPAASTGESTSAGSASKSSAHDGSTEGHELFAAATAAAASTLASAPTSSPAAVASGGLECLSEEARAVLMSLAPSAAAPATPSPAPAAPAAAAGSDDDEDADLNGDSDDEATAAQSSVPAAAASAADDAAAAAAAAGAGAGAGVDARSAVHEADRAAAAAAAAAAALALSACSAAGATAGPATAPVPAAAGAVPAALAAAASASAAATASVRSLASVPELIACLAPGGVLVTTDGTLSLPPPLTAQLALRGARLAFLAPWLPAVAQNRLGGLRHLLHDALAAAAATAAAAAADAGGAGAGAGAGVGAGAVTSVAGARVWGLGGGVITLPLARARQGFRVLATGSAAAAGVSAGGSAGAGVGAVILQPGTGV